MKQILVITYHFAPELATGAIRANKFCELLPEFGWSPTVLSVDSRQYAATDPAWQPPAIRVVRTSIGRSPRQLLLCARDACSRLRPFMARNGLRRSGEELAHDRQVTSSPAANGSRGRLRHEALALLTVLDDQVGWVPAAFRAASRLLRQDRIDTILTSGPPHSTHVIGLLLKRRFGVPWVADLRDPWSLQAMEMVGATKLSRALEFRLEALVVRHADLVLTTATRLSQAMRRLHAGVPPERFQTVTNGFDRADFAVTDEFPPHFAVAHVGNLFFRLSPRQVIRAWGRLVEQQRLPRGRARFTFLGDCDPELDPAAMAREAGLGDIFTVAPRVPPAQAIRTIRQSDLLLVFCQDLPLAIPSKIFDYLASGADILALAPDGALADLLASVGRGTVVPPDDTDAIAAALERSWHAYQRGETRSRPRPATADPAIAEFERRALTRVLAGHLDHLCCRAR